MKFYLGAHHTHWLEHLDVPLFISRRRLEERKSFPRATCDWALDSGGFSELSLHGKWTITPERYVEQVRQYSEQIGRLDWAAIMDYMCEPDIRKMTGLTVADHQRLTVENLLALRELAPEINWAPVLQGWDIEDYYTHLDLYIESGVDLRAFPVVGIGSVCRRQDTAEVEELIIDFARDGYKLHGFGFKVGGLKRVWNHLASADSMAWSYQARRREPLDECKKRAAEGQERGHKNCANCRHYAMMWRQNMMSAVQTTLAGRNNEGGMVTKHEIETIKNKGPVQAEVLSTVEGEEIEDREDRILARAEEIIRNIGQNYYELGAVLYEVEAGEYYRKLNYASFEEYVEMKHGFARTKAKNVIRLWEVLDQHLKIEWERIKDIPWTNIRTIFPILAPRGGAILSLKEAKTWLLEAKKRPRAELAELVRKEKEARRPQEPNGGTPTRRKIEDEDDQERLDEAAENETPFVEETPPSEQELLSKTDEITDDALLGKDEVVKIDPDTGEQVERLIRMTAIVSRDEYSHITAAMDRMAQVTGQSHPGKLLDLMAAEINQTLADKEAGGAAQRLDWYVANLERIFGVKISVEVPAKSPLRKMSKV